MKTNNTGGPAFPHLRRQISPLVYEPIAEGGMTLLDYFAARAPREIPDWFKHPPATPRPTVPVPHKTLTAEQYADWQGLGDWIDEVDVSQETRDFHAIYTAAHDALATWTHEQTVARYFAWRWYYAEMMVSAREAL